MQIPLSLIQSSPNPIRTTWDDEKLNELAQSLKEQGQIQAIKVRSCADGYEIVYGHRRVEAARRAGFETIDATLEEMSDQQTLVQALIENVQREDMTPIDTAKGLKGLVDKTGWSLREIERQGIMPQDQSSRLLSLLTEPEEIQQMISDGDTITPWHVRQAREVIKDNPVLRTAVLQKSSDENLSAAQTRRLAESVAAAPSEPARARLLDWGYSELLHDPSNIKERAERLGARDPMYVDLHPAPATKDWMETPAVSSVISLMKGWMTSLTNFRKADEIGKMSPEAKDYIARRAREFATALIEWADKLENKENG